MTCDGVVLILLGVLTLWLAWRQYLEGVVLAAALFILPGVASLESGLGGSLGDVGRLAIGPITVLLLLNAMVQETGRYVLLSVSARQDRSALSAGYAWAAWDLAQGLLVGMHNGGGSLDGVVDLLMMRALPSLLHIGLSFVQLWAVRARRPGQRALIFSAGVVAHLVLTLLILRHGHL